VARRADRDGPTARVLRQKGNVVLADSGSPTMAASEAVGRTVKSPKGGGAALWVGEQADRRGQRERAGGYSEVPSSAFYLLTDASERAITRAAVPPPMIAYGTVIATLTSVYHIGTSSR